MATFWLWVVRNPAILLAGFAAFLGYQGAADWSIAMVVVLGFGLVAEAGNRLGRRALARKRRKQAAIEALRSATEVRERLRMEHRRKAA
ncbi:MAG: hypothetical protein AMXMBFR80_15580 [Dehalococcoidia bacterium]|jgi:hypothetical protein|nr:hypothetical protein [Tepidiformaceae bacterium]